MTTCVVCENYTFHYTLVFRVYYYRQIDTFETTVFSDSGVSKRKDMMKIPKVIPNIKPIPSHMVRM